MERQVRKTCDYVVSYAVSERRYNKNVYVDTNNYMRTSRVCLVQKEDESELKFIDTVHENPAEICMRLQTAVEQITAGTGVTDFDVCILNYWRDDKSCWGYKENP